MRLSVVVPALNEGAIIGALCRDLLARPEPDRPDELIVVDGGSTDKTAELARAAGATVLESPCGRGVQLASGARRATGELLFFLHADALPGKGALVAIREAFRGDELLATCALSQRVDAKGLFFRAVERCADWRVRRGMVYGDSGLCVRRTSYEAVGGFRELPLFEDVDLSRRMSTRGRPRLLADAQLTISARRWRAEGALRCTFRNWMLMTLYLCGVSPSRLARHYSPLQERPGPDS